MTFFVPGLIYGVLGQISWYGFDRGNCVVSVRFSEERGMLTDETVTGMCMSWDRSWYFRKGRGNRGKEAWGRGWDMLAKD